VIDTKEKDHHPKVMVFDPAEEGNRTPANPTSREVIGINYIVLPITLLQLGKTTDSSGRSS